jgi:hypothetical protein
MSAVNAVVTIVATLLMPEPVRDFERTSPGRFVRKPAAEPERVGAPS